KNCKNYEVNLIMFTKYALSSSKNYDFFGLVEITTCLKIKNNTVIILPDSEYISILMNL
ncbi:hypothetical protein ACJX0J_034436, partial [Zea mays]